MFTRLCTRNQRPYKDFLKEAEFTRDVDIANAVDTTLTKFKSSDKFTALLKKDNDVGFDEGEGYFL